MKKYIFNALKSYLINQSIKDQEKSYPKDLMKWGLMVNDQGQVAVNGISAKELVSGYGSPLLVVNHCKLREDAMSIQNAVKSISQDSKVLYSYKTNCIPGILSQ